MTLFDGIFLHGFGPRYDLPAPLFWYLFAAAGVVVISFVLVVAFAGDQVGAKALQYPRRAVPSLLRWRGRRCRGRWGERSASWRWSRSWSPDCSAPRTRH